LRRACPFATCTSSHTPFWSLPASSSSASLSSRQDAFWILSCKTRRPLLGHEASCRRPAKKSENSWCFLCAWPSQSRCTNEAHVGTRRPVSLRRQAESSPARHLPGGWSAPGAMTCASYHRPLLKGDSQGAASFGSAMGTCLLPPSRRESRCRRRQERSRLAHRSKRSRMGPSLLVTLASPAE
jgi:hypothetical protein